MKLLDKYNEYTKLSKAYLEWIEKLVEMDFEGYNKEEIKVSLLKSKDELQSLMEAVSILEAEPEQETNLKDLKYLIMDLVFLAQDLAYFYELGETGRFKMRALNAVNKKKRAEMFNEGLAGGGNCPMNLM